MLIGILSDIHGNYGALQQVLREARNEQIEHLFILGDTVGYYYDAVGVHDLLKDWTRNMIRGNHEDMLMGLLEGTIPAADVKRKYGSALELALRTLSENALIEIQKLKSTEVVTINNCTSRLCHGAPWDTNQYLYPNASPELLSRCNEEGVDFVFLGHTHYPLRFQAQHSCIINPGSVGQSRIRGGVAEWGILNTATKKYKAVQTKYDTALLKAQARKVDPGVKYLVEILERNPA